MDEVTHRVRYDLLRTRDIGALEPGGHDFDSSSRSGTSRNPLGGPIQDGRVAGAHLYAPAPSEPGVPLCTAPGSSRPVSIGRRHSSGFVRGLGPFTAGAVCKLSSGSDAWIDFALANLTPLSTLSGRAPARIRSVIRGGVSGDLLTHITTPRKPMMAWRRDESSRGGNNRPVDSSPCTDKSSHRYSRMTSVA